MHNNLLCVNSVWKMDGHVIEKCLDPRWKVAKFLTLSKPMASINTNETDDISRAFRSKGTLSTEDIDKC